MQGTVVFGGAGFIGSNLVEQLLAMGHDVTVVDDLSQGSVANLSIAAIRARDAAPRVHGPGSLEFIRGSIRDYDLVLRVCTNKRWVFHLAAMSRIQPSIVDPLLAWQQNIVGTGNVLEACRAARVERIVYSASSSAYGEKNSPPMREDMPTDCLNPYSLSKRVGEEMMELYRKLYGLSTVSLRYFNVYGPRHQEEGDYATVIAIFRRQRRLAQPLTVVGDGEQRRDFTFVRDVVDANIMAAMNREAHGTLNIGTGMNHSINEIAARVGGPTVNVPPRAGEARVTLADTAKARSLLGWEPRTSLEFGLAVLDHYERKNALIVPGA